MATSATSTFELARDSLFRRAFQLAGLFEASQTPGSADYSMASDILGMELDSLHAEGVVLTHRERTTKALVASTAAYTLDTDAIDVLLDGNNVAGTIVPTSGGETTVLAITQAEYVQITNKSTEGTPSLVLIERAASLTATFWPVPSATSTFRYAKVRLPRDADTGAVTLDLARRWQKAVCYALAWQLAQAKSKPMERVMFLKRTADDLKKAAFASDGLTTNAQFYVPRYA